MAAWGQATGWRDFRGPAAGLQPVVPQRPRPQAQAAWSGPPAAPPPQSQGAVLIGVVDNGCPFAHRMLQRPGGGTRVLSLWDQDPWAPAFTTAGGGAPAMGGGCVVHRPALDALCALGEAEAYRRAGYAAVRGTFGHGAAVLDLLCGPVPLEERLMVHPDRPPRWRPAHDAASRADLVFVQLARDLVQDSSSAALEPAVLAGIDHVMRCAGRQTRTVVVNVSEGSSRGPHDGRAAFDAALQARVQAAWQRGLALHVVLPAGNSATERRHAWLPAAPQPAGVVLQVPPGNETAVFVTARVPRGVGVQLRLRAPHADPGPEVGWVGEGQALGWCAAQRQGPAAAVIWPAGAAVATLAWAPTHGEAPGFAPHGPWRLEVRCAGGGTVAEGVDLWVSRCARNATALPRSVQPHFVDTDGRYDPGRHLRERDHDPEPPGSPLRRVGTLNALATGASVQVAGGLRVRDGLMARYSARGRRGGGEGPPMRGPDALRTTDLSRITPGVPAAGNRSGSTVRVIGTSFAAPQLARALANGAAVPPAATSAPAAGAGTPATAPPAPRSRRAPAPS